jgi:hypothetical protein
VPFDPRTELGVLEARVVIAREGVAVAEMTLDAWRAELVAAQATVDAFRLKFSTTVE